MRNVMMISVLGLLLAGCSLKVADREVAKVGDGGGDRAEDSYELSENGCTTKRQSFSGSEEDVRNRICAALQDESLNRGCAQNLRAKLFATKCPGEFKPKYRSGRTSAELAETMLLNVDGLTKTEREEATNALADLL